MTSIAAYLAGLAGGAPQDGQKANQATATSASGLFAALLTSTEGETAAGTETGASGDPLGLIASGAANAELTEVASGDQTLGELLTQGLPQATGDVEAEITDAAGNGETIADIAAGTVVTGTDEIEPDPADAPSIATDQPAVVDAEAGLAVAAVLPHQETGQPVEDGADISPSPISRASAADTPPPAQPDAQARNKGLENALQRSSQRGRQNGLQNALNQAPQAGTGQGTGTGQGAGTGQTAGTNGEGQSPATQSGTAEAESNRPRVSIATDDDSSTRPAQGRAEIADRGHSAIQRILDAGNGKKVIQINERIGGETAGTTSPPTLTANVSASAASPGPVSPNAPHVPVSALAVHIAQQFKNGVRRFDIRLDPPELGRIDVRLDVTRDGQVTTHLVVERSETLDLLQRDARQLERALQDAGLDTSKEGMKFSLKDQGLAGGEQQNYGTGDDDHIGSDQKEGEDHAHLADDAMPPPVRYMALNGLDIRI